VNVRQIGSGHVKTDLLAKVKAVKEELKKNDFVWLHIKGADEASHDCNFEEKKAFIERVDREVIKEIRELRDVLIVITADHVTSVYSGEHEPGYVPLLIYGAGKDNVQIFDENSCAKGELGILEATNLLERILALAK
jgi:2,3-bisphosphoglycerate-independent phosphoglycerate mutase